MQPLNVLRHLVQCGPSCTRFLILLLALLLVECGHTDIYDGPPPCSPWGDYGFSFDYVLPSASSVYLRGTAFSDPPVSSCSVSVGPDTSMAVNWTNQSNGAKGVGKLWYAWSGSGIIPISQCEHYWDATVPIVSGMNVIDVTVSGKNHSCTLSTDLVAQPVQGSPGTGFDTTPPFLISINPVNYATGVAVNTVITASFSEPMIASTITPTTFTLNNGVTGTVTYSGNTATFTPTSNLASSTTYTATITTGVRNMAGNAMASNYTWIFTTGTVGVASDFVGTWVNNAPPPVGITHLFIGQSGSNMTVHAYGECSPSDCDWGTITAPYTGNPFIAVYEFGFKTDTLTIQLNSIDSLYVHSANVFHDGTNRDYTADEYFHKQ